MVGVQWEGEGQFGGVPDVESQSKRVEVDVPRHWQPVDPSETVECQQVLDVLDHGVGGVWVAVVEGLRSGGNSRVEKDSDIGHHSRSIVLPVNNLKVFFVDTWHHNIKSVILESLIGDIGIFDINGDSWLGDVGGADVEPGEDFRRCEFEVEIQVDDWVCDEGLRQAGFGRGEGQVVGRVLVEVSGLRYFNDLELVGLRRWEDLAHGVGGSQKGEGDDDVNGDGYVRRSFWMHISKRDSFVGDVGRRWEFECNF
jgi:hypothetical protein